MAEAVASAGEHAMGASTSATPGQVSPNLRLLDPSRRTLARALLLRAVRRQSGFRWDSRRLGRGLVRWFGGFEGRGAGEWDGTGRLGSCATPRLNRGLALGFWWSRRGAGGAMRVKFLKRNGVTCCGFNAVVV